MELTPWMMLWGMLAYYGLICRHVHSVYSTTSSNFSPMCAISTDLPETNSIHTHILNCAILFEEASGLMMRLLMSGRAATYGFFGIADMTSMWAEMRMKGLRICLSFDNTNRTLLSFSKV